MGGDEVTQSIAYAFDTSLEEAKRLKEKLWFAKTFLKSMINLLISSRQ